ncbi:hypothetical protein M9434_006714 [Picochlorum sp. BPE23]|nr:hypothetical protein M9434_006714 [Picochlorum sp. BPE23]KAI8102177.1 hypothetical protein M9435_005783 [Picochlorum sp. BPE23]|mmetsp:Transcript_5310/g.10481  ORF Transcript_5310/g.10481 Transcript_5310/m.10481 type:complete len:83 (+) Transcript_5310:50-298(+)|eukprot:jgi/Picre1/31484/NNA_006836.t1
MALQSKFLNQGLPLVLLTVGGWFALSQFVKNRIDAQEAQRTHVDDRAPVQKQRAKKFNLQEEAERIRKHHIENEYKNKPISR